MMLRTKTAMSVGLVLLVCAALVFGVSHFLIAAGIRRAADSVAEEVQTALEARARRAVDVTLSGLREEAGALADRVSSWARRDDTYAYVQSRSLAWRRANLPDSVCSELGLSVIVIVASSGRIVDRLSYDLDRGTFGDLPAGLAPAIAQGGALVTFADRSAVTSGIIALPEGPMLVASCPILPSAAFAEARGAFIIGRFLTPGRLALLAERAGAGVGILGAADAGLPADVRAAAASWSTAPVFQSAPGAVTGYVPVIDVSGSPSLIARIEARDDASAHAVAALRTVRSQVDAASIWTALLLAGSALTVLGTALLVQEVAVLRRTAALGARLDEIAAEPASSWRVEAHGDDELARLENSVNEALAAVGEAGRQATERERSLAATVHGTRLALQATGQIVFEVDMQAGRISLEGAVTRITGRAAEELRSVPLSTWEAMVHPDDKAAAVAAVEQAAASGTPYRQEIRLKRTDATYVTVEHRGARAPGEAARVVGAVRAIHHAAGPSESFPTGAGGRRGS